MWEATAACRCASGSISDAQIAPRVEAEIAFVLGRDLKEEQPTIADAIGAVDFCLPAIEIVDSRIAEWKIKIVDTIADNASSGLFVLGCESKLLVAPQSN